VKDLGAKLIGPDEVRKRLNLTKQTPNF